MKIINPAFLLTISVSFFCCYGCHRAVAPQERRAHEKENITMHAQAQILNEGTEAFFILFDQKIVEAHKQTPDTFYIKGVMEEGEFSPKSDILGVGELASSGRYGWLELSSKEFYPMESDKKALTPFVKGYMTGKGFVPSLRDVFKEP